MKTYYVYILASGVNGTIYVGVTNDLLRRLSEHKQSVVDGFTKQYGVSQLVYFEDTESIEAAIDREKQLKNWRRRWKTDLINEGNPTWRDLSEDFDS
jgi:putative endonuclease